MGASQPQHTCDPEKGPTRASVEQSLETIAAATAKTVEPIKPSENESPCEPGQDRRDSNPCAQWKADDAARSSADWAKLQTILPAIGLLGVLYSLHLIRKAIRDATGAAERALASPHENAWRELRAYS